MPSNLVQRQLFPVFCAGGLRGACHLMPGERLSPYACLTPHPSSPAHGLQLPYPEQPHASPPISFYSSSLSTPIPFYTLVPFYAFSFLVTSCFLPLEPPASSAAGLTSEVDFYNFVLYKHDFL